MLANTKNHELYGIQDSILPKRWYPHRYHRLQSQLWRTNCRFPVVVAGRGSGKTEIARRYITRWLPVKKPWDDPKYVYAMPTYQQAERVAWPDLIKLVPESWVARNGINNSKLTITTKFGSTLFVVGMDKPVRIEGIQIDGCIFDETSDQKPDGFTKTVIPMLTHRNAWCWQIGVPKRTGVGAARFKECYDQGVRGEKGYESYTWPSNDILTPDQLEDLLSKVSVKDAQEQFGGIWVDVGGGIYYAFSEMENVSDRAVYRRELPIGIGSDFNVHPMAWVVFHIIGNEMYVFDEIHLENSNTQAALNELAQRYGTHENGFVFFGDATGRARRSAASSSDYIQIMNDNRFSNKITGKRQDVRYSLANPAVVDRYAAVNAMCLNGMQKRRLFINPRCTELRKDLTTRTYKEGTKEPDNTNKMSGHISDALGYPIYSMFPVSIAMAEAPQVHFGSAV